MHLCVRAASCTRPLTQVDQYIGDRRSAAGLLASGGDGRGAGVDSELSGRGRGRGRGHGHGHGGAAGWDKG
jgi:hypothetical protein